MRAYAALACLAVSVSGCSATYTVKFVNNSPFATDFRVDEEGLNDDTFADDVAANGGTATVSHTSPTRLGIATAEIASGLRIGQDLVAIDARCTTDVTAGDTVNVVKAADGSLSCTVTPGNPPVRVIQQTGQAVLRALGR